MECVLEHINSDSTDVLLIDYTLWLEEYKNINKNYTRYLMDQDIKTVIALAMDSLCMIIIKKKIIEKIKFPELRNGEDSALIPQLLKECNSVQIIPENLYNYRVRKDSGSNQVDINAYYSFLKSYEIIENNIRNEYEHECEFIGIKNILYAATIVGIKANISKEEIKRNIRHFKKKYPKYYINKYNRFLPIYKRIYIYMAGANIYVFLRIYGKIHARLL